MKIKADKPTILIQAQRNGKINIKTNLDDEDTLMLLANSLLKYSKKVGIPYSWAIYLAKVLSLKNKVKEENESNYKN